MALDLWVCQHYRVLPTERRFQELSEKQKALLFLGFAEIPTDDQLHRAYTTEQADTMSDDDAKNFKTLGYSDDQIDRIKENLKKAGLM